MNPQKPHYKSGQLICKLLEYFKFNDIKAIYSQDFNTKIALKSSGHTIQNLGSKKTAKDSPVSFTFIAYLNDENKTRVENLLIKPGKEIIILIRNIRRDKQTFSAWNLLKKNPSVTVSIDTFHHGILFRRQGQVKEHFKIRL